ncbi:HAD family hydrolase [Kosmotoga arenicorallina S304]|uniref:HAD family hydrolase n=1 Tax=Kosmotoga arenicorallina S304 TaxID=1453497 RepID=A0A176K163_9BACT|nr:HAD-IIA family hydrolase [Kosmotoga arenicorallina]OAA30436.1 HAD family hydrolase [Kosmotoga arenicorallina S304]
MFENKRLFVLDLDGTFYLGNKLLPGSLEFAEKVHSMGADLVFLTNNSSATKDEYVDKLVRLGVPENLFDVYTSAEATIRFLKENFPKKRVYLLAVPSVEKLFQWSGIELVDEKPDLVVMTYDKTLTYEKIEKFCDFVRLGVPFVTSHPDINCPTEKGPIPDVGSFIALVEASTGRRPDYVIGKPNKEILEMLIRDFDSKKEETVMIGDRLYTDIECGLRAGVETILVLSGETTSNMIPEDPPYHVYKNLEDIVKSMK